MPTGARLYVQVPDIYSHPDILQWRQEFIAAFDFYEGLDDLRGVKYIEEYVFGVALYGSPDIGPPDNVQSAWDVFPNSIFLKLYTMLDYYGPGYERGSIDKMIEVGDWVDNRIPKSAMWYGADSTSMVWPFTKSVREVFGEYFKQVGWKPYKAKEEDWKEVQVQYLHRIKQAQRNALSELKQQRSIR